MPSTPPSAARLVVGGGALLAVFIAWALVACSGSIVSLAGDQPTDDGGFASVDPETIRETMRTCVTGTSHPFVCCRFEEAGATLSCGAWTDTPFNPCPDGYAKYFNPVTCCTAAGLCTPGTDDSESDATMLSVIDAGDAAP